LRLALWQRGKDVSIKVYRGWPDTTTYLRFTDAAAEKQMNAEMEAEKPRKPTGRPFLNPRRFRALPL